MCGGGGIPARDAGPAVDLVVCLALLAAQAATPADSLEQEHVTGTLGVALDAQLSRYAEYGFWGTVLVVRQGEIVLLKGYGLANAERGTPNTPATRFEMNSMTKMFTGLAILQLDAAGRLHVTDPVERYLGAFPPGKQGSTIAQLANHTAGLIVQGTGLDLSSRTAFVNDVKRTPRESPAGERYRYTNAGFSLLGALIEIVSGESYEDYIRRHAFAPAGLRTALFRDEVRLADPLYARGYVGTPATLERSPQIAYGWGTRGSGGVWSTVGDMYRWVVAVEQGKLLPEPQQRTLFSPTAPPALEAYGWHVDTTDEGRPRIHKGGGSAEVASQLLYYPRERIVIVWTSNNLRQRWRQALNRTISQVALGDGVPLLPALARRPKHMLQANAGRYVAGRDTLELRAGLDCLYAAASSFRVPASIPFYPQDSTSYIGFDPNTGTQTRLHFGQGGALSVQMADGRTFSLTR